MAKDNSSCRSGVLPKAGKQDGPDATSSRRSGADPDATPFGTGRRALVTGAGSGIGRAAALALAQEGFEVLLVGRDSAKLAAVAEVVPSPVRIIAADIATSEGRAAIRDAVGERLDVLVNSAGQYLREPVASLSAEAWDALDAVNVRAPILLSQAVLTQLKSVQGQIVFINSSTGLVAGGQGMAAYAAGKHALKAAAEVLRQEVNRDGVRVLSVYPGRTDTAMQAAILAAEGRVAQAGALMRPEDVADMVVAALRLPRTAEVTDIVMRPMRPLR